NGGIGQVEVDHGVQVQNDEFVVLDKLVRSLLSNPVQVARAHTGADFCAAGQRPCPGAAVVTNGLFNGARYMVFSDPCADCLTARVEANICYQGSGAQAFELCRFRDQDDVIEQGGAGGDVGGWQQLFELQVFIRADHARGNLSSARVGEIDAEAAFLQPQFLQFGGDRLGEVREGEGRNFGV